MPLVFFWTLAVSLLILTMIWRVPMMLWDHLDLVPILAAWNDGNLAQSGFLHFHGGHMHTAAYAVLLATTTLSAGRPWLDCLTSFALLLAFAAIVFAWVKQNYPAGSGKDLLLALFTILLTLYPGHLANLQWGWQVAVFMCLAGVGVTLHSLTRETLTWTHTALAMAAAGFAFFSFATAIALFPTAVAVIALRHDYPVRIRCLFALPWTIACVLIVCLYFNANLIDESRDVHLILPYALNFLGAGISRFANDLAPYIAGMGVMIALAWLPFLPRQRESLPWIGLLVFALATSVLVALGRATPFGSDQAFATRYVSFSSLFWLGWAGLLGSRATLAWNRTRCVLLAVAAVFASINALHMINKAREVGERTRAIAQTICDTWPSVDRQLLDEIYFDQPELAWQRLARLRDWGYAPFERCPVRSH